MRPQLPALSEYVSLLEEIWASRMLSNFGTFAQRLEGIASDYLGVSNVAAVASGDIGLMIALRALELPDGSPCYLTSFTFNSTINAVLWNRLRPVFVDIDEETYNMSPDGLRGAVAEEDQPGVVLATHVFGNPCDVQGLRQAAGGATTPVIFDAAHAYGSSRQGVKAGNLGDIEVFSLSGTKLVTSAEGGMVVTADESLAERIRYLRAYGFQHDYHSRFVGINGKLSELHSALGTLTLPTVEDAVNRRNQLAQLYREHLGARVAWQRVEEGDRSSYKDLSIRLGSRRDEVEEVLKRAEVQTKRYFLPLHRMDPFRGFARRSLPATEKVYEESLCVPIFNDMKDSDVELISEHIARVMAGKR